MRSYEFVRISHLVKYIRIAVRSGWLNPNLGTLVFLLLQVNWVRKWGKQIHSSHSWWGLQSEVTSSCTQQDTKEDKEAMLSDSSRWKNLQEGFLQHCGRVNQLLKVQMYFCHSLKWVQWESSMSSGIGTSGIATQNNNFKQVSKRYTLFKNVLVLHIH